MDGLRDTKSPSGNDPDESPFNQNPKMEEGGWFTKTPRGSAGSSPWKDISKESRQVQQFCVFVLGDGDIIKFWEDF